VTNIRWQLTRDEPAPAVTRWCRRCRAGYTATTPTTVNVTLTSGSTGTANYLDTQPSGIAGSVLVDVKRQRRGQPEDTTGISGVTVVLARHHGVALATNVTTASGAYLFHQRGAGQLRGGEPIGQADHTLARPRPMTNASR